MRDMEEKAKSKDETLRQKQTQEDKSNKNDTLEPKIRKAIDEGRQYVEMQILKYLEKKFPVN